jgi:hypothetical protein
MNDFDNGLKIANDLFLKVVPETVRILPKPNNHHLYRVLLKVVQIF